MFHCWQWTVQAPLVINVNKSSVCSPISALHILYEEIQYRIQFTLAFIFDLHAVTLCSYELWTMSSEICHDCSLPSSYSRQSQIVVPHRFDWSTLTKICVHLTVLTKPMPILILFEPRRKKTCPVFATRVDSNWPAQLLKLGRGLKFWI